MTSKFKPMLAYTVKDLDKVSYPVYVSPKLDGIRAIVLDGVVYSRTMKPIRSQAVQDLFGKEEYNGFDGELIYGDPTTQDVFNKSTSFCMSKEIPEGMNKNLVKFAVFDLVIDGDFRKRNYQLFRYLRKEYHRCKLNGYGEIEVIGHTLCYNRQEVCVIEDRYLNIGYEGVMLNSPNGVYKQGRSTEKEGYLGKLKRFSDSEAIVIGFEELMHNTNEAKKNEIGNTERSSSKEGLVGGNILGNLLVKDLHSGVEFSIGSGFDLDTRASIWNNKEEWLGKIVKYKYFAIQSAYEKPRFPTYIGIRDVDDI